LPGHQFLSYSSADARDFALCLHDALEAGPPHMPAWLDRRDILPGQDWDAEIDRAIQTCASLLFVMSPDSVEDPSVCKQEWSRALRFKKPVVPILFDRKAVPPFRLESRQHIDFTGPFDQALAKLRNHLAFLASPAGALRELEDRLADARRDLRRAEGPEHEARIQDDIVQLESEIATQRRIVADPEAARRRTEASIASALERERQPSRTPGGESRTKFLNPPPAVAPSYFQNRFLETKLIADFLKDDARRLMVLVGRAGIGKTAMVCRILKGLERGVLPDDLGPLDVDGIIYLSAIGSRRVTAPNLYEDLLKLLPEDARRGPEAVVRDPKTAPEAKMRALLEAFPAARTVVLLDNFEDVIDPETHEIADAELAEILHALLALPHDAVKVLVTTRVAPRALGLVEPSRQMRLNLEEGLESPYAENILRELDADGKLGLKSASEAQLALARERTRGFPRALEALYAILAADRDTTLEEILNATSGERRDHVTHALVGAAFSRLDPTQQRVMQALAVFGRPVSPAAVDYLLQPDRHGIDSAPILGRLVNMHFARKEAGRYFLHPVDREYALARLASDSGTDRNGREDGPTRQALTRRAAEFFKATRLPRKDWKTIEDLTPQLAEFDLRCENQDYETAAAVFAEISLGYLQLWGWSRLVVEMGQRLNGRLRDDSGWRGRILNDLGQCYCDLGQMARAIDYHVQSLAIFREVRNRGDEGAALVNLGVCYSALGQLARSIDYHEQALAISREVGNRGGEGAALGNLGGCYSDLGQVARAIDYLEQALAISREVGNRGGEGIALGQLGLCYRALGQLARAIDYHEQALAISREVGDRVGEGFAASHLAFAGLLQGRPEEAIQQASGALQVGEETGFARLISTCKGVLAFAHLGVGDMPAARAATGAACASDAPANRHRAQALLGLIALRQGDRTSAADAFRAAIAHAGLLLGDCAQNYGACDARGLALDGLAVLEGGSRAAEAIAAYRAARAITCAPGIVADVKLRLEALAPADTAGVLAGVYEAATTGDGPRE
jgi:tetratricopeptide (TPR) repeat protein